MREFHIDGLQSAIDPASERVNVYDVHTDELIFSGTADDAELFMEITGYENVESTILHDIMRGFE